MARAGAQFDVGDSLTKVSVGRTIRKYRRGATVFAQGDAADAVFYIQKGTVKATVRTGQGKKATLSIFGRDEFIGECSLIRQLRRIATATALTECRIMEFEKATIARLLRDEPAFSKMFVAHLVARKIRVEEDLVDQIVNTAERRLARALLRLANFGKNDVRDKVIEKMSHEVLAEIVGTTRSRVSLFMNNFRKAGFISYGETLTIRHSLTSVLLPV